MSESSISALGLATTATDGSVLSVWYPDPTSESPGGGFELAELEGERPATETTCHLVTTTINPSEPPADPADAYLRLHLLSHRVFKPNQINVDSIFAVLNNVVWTDRGPLPVEAFARVKSRVDRDGSRLDVHGVDKFPRMTDFVVPPGVRIANADRVRLGAYLGEGTTVMHEGFINFNAGTLGTSMVEGRISAGVVVGDGSDIGGGASIMGTLSGGGTEVVSVGQRCLLGANSGLGISLGNDCVVEAGLYLTAGTVVALPDGTTIKARDLSGADNLLFRRNSMSGAVEAMPKTGSWGGLNEILHNN